MRPRLLFIYLQRSSFVREDVHILEQEYEVVPFQFGRSEKVGAIAFAALLMKQLVWLLRELPRADAVYGWFADYHMVLPVLLARGLRKPVAIAMGGFDAIALPSLDYGIVLSRWRWPLAQLVVRLADLLLPVSPSLVRSVNPFSEWPRESAQGLRSFLPDLETEMRVLPTGYDPDVWPEGPMGREPLVSTVGLIDSDRTLRRKGVDLVFETARRMPDIRFRVIGVQDPEHVRKRYAPPNNVQLLEPVRREALIDHYHDTSVYVQLSRAEGLPNVLCEAMLCGCIPVGSRAFGIPDGIGDAGYVVDAPNSQDIENAIRKALDGDASRRQTARQHIIGTFHIERRRRDLLHLLRVMRGVEQTS